MSNWVRTPAIGPEMLQPPVDLPEWPAGMLRPAGKDRSMADIQTNGKPEVVAAPPSEGYPKQWFCVAVAPDGSIFKGDSESPAQFVDIVGKSVIAWMDYWTDNYDRDAPVAAVQAWLH